VQEHPALHIHVHTAQQKYRMAYYGFQFLGSHAAPAVPELTQLLSSTNAQTQQIAIVALASIGPAASSAASALEPLAGKTNSPNFYLVASTLARIRVPPQSAN